MRNTYHKIPMVALKENSPGEGKSTREGGMKKGEHTGDNGGHRSGPMSNGNASMIRDLTGCGDILQHMTHTAILEDGRVLRWWGAGAVSFVHRLDVMVRGRPGSRGENAHCFQSGTPGRRSCVAVQIERTVTHHVPWWNWPTSPTSTHPQSSPTLIL